MNLSSIIFMSHDNVSVYHYCWSPWLWPWQFAATESMQWPLCEVIRVLQFLECICCLWECEILHLGAFRRGLDWRKFLILQWQAVVWNEKNKFRLNRNVSFREQRLSLGILLDDGAPFWPGVAQPYLITADPDIHGSRGKGGIKLSSLDLELGGRWDIAYIRSTDRADLVSLLAAKTAWSFQSQDQAGTHLWAHSWVGNI